MYYFLKTLLSEKAKIYTIPKAFEGTVYSVEGAYVKLALGAKDEHIVVIAMEHIVAVEEI